MKLDGQLTCWRKKPEMWPAYFTNSYILDSLVKTLMTAGSLIPTNSVLCREHGSIKHGKPITSAEY